MEYQIVAIQVPAEAGNTVLVQVLMRAKRDLLAHDVLALHFNSKEGRMIANFDHKLDFCRTSIPAGTYWVQKFNVPKAQLDRAFSFGFAMYDTPSSLFDAEGDDRDWNGKRLIVPLVHR